jgi:hypothetical protein
MAVSYANELSLAVITTGTEAGTWGTLTNDNFQYALTQAIGGKATVTFTTTTTTLTPTSTNGLQDFRALFLTCSGSPGAASTLVVPAINKPYLIKNSLTGGYDLTVKIGSSTGTVVPNGKTMFLYANGSDVITTNDYFSTLATAGALTVGTSASPATTTLNGNLTVGTTAVTSGTYGRAGSVVTVTSSSHGFSNGQVLYLSFSAGTGGTATTGVYTIANVTTNTFEVTDTASGSITGSPAVSITKYNNSASFNTPLTVPAAFGSSGTSGQYLISQGTGAPPKWDSISSVPGAFTVGGNLTVNGTQNTLGAVTTSSGTYGRSGATVTVTSTGHGFADKQVLYLDFSAGTGGTATDGFYSITFVDANTFTVTDTSSGTISGSPAVSISRYSSGTSTVSGTLNVNGGASVFTSPAYLLRNVRYLTSGTSLTGCTYSIASTTVTVTKADHGLSTGDLVYLTFTASTGTAPPNDSYSVTVSSSSIFTVTVVSGSGTGTAVADAPAVYTPPPGVRALEVTVIGGGGGGGGGDGTATSNAVGPSGAGGGGGFATAFVTTDVAGFSFKYNIGPGGAGGAAGANNGSVGGTTRFRNTTGSSMIISATGGNGGSGQTIDSSVTAGSTAGGVGSITGSVSSSLVGAGTRSSFGRGHNGLTYSLPMSGFCPLIGGGASANTNVNGTNASNYGEGGSGVLISNVTTNYAGGSGFAGLVIIKEYY